MTTAELQGLKAEVRRLIDIINHAMLALEQDMPGEAWSALKAGTRPAPAAATSEKEN